MTNEDQEKHFLVGKFFHSWAISEDKQFIKWQGVVVSVDYVNQEIGMVASCQLYSWIDSVPTFIVVVKVSEMISVGGVISFSFYKSKEDWILVSEANERSANKNDP